MTLRCNKTAPLLSVSGREEDEGDDTGALAVFSVESLNI